MVSIFDVARAANVSVATISRAFNEPDKVSAETLGRVNQAVQDLGYSPNVSARMLRTQRSRVLAVVLPTLLNPVFAECLKGIADTAAAAGYSILTFFTDYQAQREEHAVNLLLAGNAEGAVLVLSNPGESKAITRLVASNRPYVLAYNRHEDYPCVTVDSEAAVADLIAQLARLGHRRIAMVSGHTHASDRAQQRQRGYLRGMQQAGLPDLPLVEVPFMESDENALFDLLRKPERPTAVIGSNDLIAIRCLRAAALCGLKVPQDISIVGFDGIRLGADLYPSLATVAQPNEDIGRHCVQLLMQALAAQTVLAADSSLLLDHSFNPAESCAAATQS